MTAQEAISVIRAEIERRMKGRHEERFCDEMNFGGEGVGFLAFLDTLKDDVMSMPEGLDEAAMRDSLDYVDDIPDGGTDKHPWNDHDIEKAYYDGMLAGAEWMAGQGVTIEAKFIKSRLRGHISLPVFFKDGEQFNNGEDVIIQVRKK